MRIAPPHTRAARTGLPFLILILAIIGVTLRAWIARLPGWDPPSLWFDDLQYSAVTRGEDLWTVLSVVTQAPPGFLVALWAARRVFDDPEWSLQIVPFFCAIAAIPLMAAVVWNLTKDGGLALLGAALTALNPLLAHYTVFVKEYSLGFFVTALLLVGAIPLFMDRAVDPRRLIALAIAGAASVFFSITSVFVSFPIVNLGALMSLRSWRTDRRRTRWALVAALGYNLVIVTAYLLFRGRSTEPLRAYFQDSFATLTSVEGAWTSLAVQGGRLLATSLPSWTDTSIWSPEVALWHLPIMVVGHAWLLARKSTRAVGVVVCGFYGAFVLANMLQIYPVGGGRTDVFLFPVGICLFVAGIHGLTSWVPRASLVRAIAGIGVGALALVHPIPVQYWDVDDARLVARLTTMMNQSDGLLLSPAGRRLVATYGPWPVLLSGKTRSGFTQPQIVRDRTVHMSLSDDPQNAVEQLVKTPRPKRLWFVAFRYQRTQHVLDSLRRQGYEFSEVERTSKGRLFLLRDRQKRPGAKEPPA